MSMMNMDQFWYPETVPLTEKQRSRSIQLSLDPENTQRLLGESFVIDGGALERSFVMPSILRDDVMMSEGIGGSPSCKSV
jgi:hypothetical protein